MVLRRSKVVSRFVSIAMLGAASIASADARGTPLNLSAIPEDPGRRETYQAALTELESPVCTVSSWTEAFSESKGLSTDLQIALANVRAAEGTVRSVLGGLLPNVSASASLGVGGATATPTRGQFGLGATLSQSVVDLAAWESLRASQADRRAAELSSVDMRRALALTLANTLFGVLTTERVAQINRMSLTQAVERLVIAERRAELGGGTAIDVVRARQDAELALALVVSANEAARRAREALGLALGRPEPCSVAAGVQIDAFTEFGESCHAVELASRADLASLRAATESAARREQTAWLGLLPSLSVGANVNQSNFFGDGGSSVAAWSLQGILSIPIWDGGSLYGRVRTASAEREVAEQELEALRRNAVIEVARARRAVTVAAASLDASQASRRDAEEVERLARSSFQQGLATSLDLISSAAQLRAAEIDFAIRELQLVSARMLAVLTLARCS